MRDRSRYDTRAACADPLRELMVQADTLAFTLDLAAALIEQEHPLLATAWRDKAETARNTIHKLPGV
jgi:hypothetical protein